MNSNRQILSSIKGRLRNMDPYKLKAASIEHVAIVPEVQHALGKWINLKLGNVQGVLIGGLAMSFYTKPRTTDDVDLLFLHVTDIPTEDSTPGFKRYRPGAFRESKTHVDIEVTSPASFENLPMHVAQLAIHTAVSHGGIKVASLHGMVALKLCGSFAPKRRFKDSADIVALLQNDLDLDMSGWGLNEEQIQRLEELREEAKK